jgi:hypothetical protein
MSTETQVGTAAHSLSGDSDKKDNYLSNVILNQTIGNSPYSSVSKAITGSLLSGPYASMSGFRSWALDKFASSVPITAFGFYEEVTKSTDLFTVEIALKTLSAFTGKTITMNEVHVGTADLDIFAEYHMRNFYPYGTPAGWYYTAEPSKGTMNLYVPGNAYGSVVDISDFSAGDPFLYVAGFVHEINVTNPFTAIVRINNQPGFEYVFHASRAIQLSRRQLFPIIPLRLENKFVNEAPYKDDLEDLCTKAYKRATGMKLEGLLDQINESDGIGDIDFAYLLQGVAANDKSDIGKRYIYNFLKSLTGMVAVTRLDFDRWKLDNAWYSANNISLAQWTTAFNNQTYINGSLPPNIYPAGLPQYTEIRSNVNFVGVQNLDMSIKVFAADRKLHTGNTWLMGKDEVVFFMKPDTSFTADGVAETMNSFEILYYDGVNSHQIFLEGVYLVNNVYADKKMILSFTEEYAKTGETSAFVFPMHEPTLRSVNIIDKNQLMSTSSIIVFNSYNIIDIPWYQSGIFKVFLFLGAIAFGVATGGIGAATVGLLGTNMAVGAAIGLSGLAAVFAGAVVNAIAAMILMSLISVASTAIFGDEIGAIVGAIIGMVAMTVGLSFASGGTWETAFDTLTRADKLLELTDATIDGVTAYINHGTTKKYELIEEERKKYEKQMEELNKLIEERTANHFKVDTLADGPSTKIDRHIPETPDTFFKRTLLTGADISNITIDMVHNYPEHNLKLPTKEV